MYVVLRLCTVVFFTAFKRTQDVIERRPLDSPIMSLIGSSVVKIHQYYRLFCISTLDFEQCKAERNDPHT